MRQFWPRLATHIPGVIVFLVVVTSVRQIDGYPWGLPALLVSAVAFGIALVLQHVVTHAVRAYFGFDEDDEGDDPDDDDDPDDPIIVPDTPEALYENAR